MVSKQVAPEKSHKRLCLPFLGVKRAVNVKFQICLFPDLTNPRIISSQVVLYQGCSYHRSIQVTLSFKQHT